MTETWQEKRAERFQRWLNPPIKFVTDEAKRLYQYRAQLFIDAIELKKAPDRVPIYPNYTFFPAYATGRTPYDVMSDAGQAKAAWSEFMREFDFDSFGVIGLLCPMAVLETLRYQLYHWPGSGIPKTSTYQYVEKDWMEADEYEALAADPSNFWNRVYLPRVFKELEGFRDLPVSTECIELPNFTGFVTPFGLPHVQAGLKKLMEAGSQCLAWMTEIGGFLGQCAAEGYVASTGGFTKAPFDTLSDTLRSMKSALMDMRRRPEAMLAALEALTPLASKMAIDAADRTGNPIIFIPLHKGADGFMSPAQFEKFYWPSLKKVMDDIIEAGCVPLPFAEGGYSTRMEYLREFPKGAVAWMIDRTDMKELKKKVGDVAALFGNVPGSILHAGTPADVEEYCKRLIEEVAPGGGFVMMPGAVLDEGRNDMVQTMIQTTRQYGKY